MGNVTSIRAYLLNDWIDQIDRDANVPSTHVLTRTPTAQDVKDYPDYYILGEGYGIASATDCGHGYNLTDSCPSCP